MSPVMPPVIKGLVLKNRLEFAQATGGERLLQRLRDTPGAVNRIMATPMLSMRPVPLVEYDLFCKAIAKLMTGDEETTYRRMGAFQADAHRALQNVSFGAKTDPAQLISGLARHLPVHLSGAFGELRHELPAERTGRISWEGHSESRDSYCLATLGYSVRLLENAGLLGVNAIHRECVAHKAPRCAWEFTWEKASGTRRSTVELNSLRSAP